ncbi:hypothetical protein [Undibacterium sp. TJN19]|uniref:hypothetical protein n=1 Tax=Undibacterium sp. TJN19 TaxID=3413055 RepID=UPI003BF17B80
MSTEIISDSASRFKILEDRVRQTSRIGQTKPTAEMEDEFKALMDRMDDVYQIAYNRHTLVMDCPDRIGHRDG